MKPTVEAVAREHSLRTVFVNVDDQPELGARYEIQSIPALRLFKNGEIIATSNGSLSKADLEHWLGENGVGKPD